MINHEIARAPRRPASSSSSFRVITAWDGVASLAEVTPDDRPVFERALMGLESPVSDMSFVTTLGWAEPLGYRWGIIEDHLCVFSDADGDLTMVLPPLELDRRARRRLGPCLETCFAIMDSANESVGVERSRIEYVSDEMIDRIRSVKAMPLTVTAMPGDYIYSRWSMVDLAGGPLKSKRKLRSRFLRENPCVETAPLSESDAEDCLSLLDRWRASGDARHEGETNDSLIGTDLLRARDRSCTARLIAAAPEFGLPSMVVRSAGHLVAFTIGDMLGRAGGAPVGLVCVEKADPEVPGAAQFIFSEFCRVGLAPCPEINVGDDWGIPSLRFTKMSYRPSMVLPKSVLTRQPTVETGAPERHLVRVLREGRRASPTPEPNEVGAWRVRRADPRDVPGIFAIEAAAFDDPRDRFTLRQVRGLVTSPRAIVSVAENNGTIIGWCVALIRQHVRWRSGRVYSVAVLPEACGRGVGRALLRATLDSLESERITRVYLEVRAANTAARQLYESLGFSVVRDLAGYYGPGADGLRMRRIARPAE